MRCPLEFTTFNFIFSKDHDDVHSTHYISQLEVQKIKNNMYSWKQNEIVGLNKQQVFTWYFKQVGACQPIPWFEVTRRQIPSIPVKLDNRPENQDWLMFPKSLNTRRVECQPMLPTYIVDINKYVRYDYEIIKISAVSLYETVWYVTYIFSDKPLSSIFFLKGDDFLENSRSIFLTKGFG